MSSETAEEYLKKHLLVNLKPNKIIDDFVYHKDALRAVEMAREQEREKWEPRFKEISIWSGMEFSKLVKHYYEKEIQEAEREVAKKIFEELDKEGIRESLFALDDEYGGNRFEEYKKIKSRWVGESK